MISSRNHSLLFIHLLMVISAALVSTSFIVGAAITDQLDPAVLTLIRFVIASMVFAPLIYYKYGATFSFDLFWRCSVISGCLVVFFWCMFLSLRYTTPLNTSVIFTLVPSISWFYAFFLLSEKLTGGKLAALFCGMVGAIWVIFRGDFSAFLAMELNKGDLIFLAGGFAIGLYTPLVKLLHRGEPMAVMTFWVLFSGSCWLFLFSGYKLPGVRWSDIPAGVWIGVCYLAVFTTVFTFFLTQYSIPFLGSTRVMAYSYLYPGMVLLIDLGLGHGLPSLSVLPGILIVLTSMVILQCSECE
ncbi:MAG: DMT family transporter [Deltaproteobacteria bacterium]|nr:DMT family transporter [Deltaproteobacteria bacterium]